MDRKISKRISLLSFIMTLTIVVYHCQCQGDPSGFGKADVFLYDALADNIDTFGMVAMSYFFAITGFLLFYKLDFKSYHEKIKKRVSSLLIPFLVWQVIFICYQSCLGARYDVSDTLSSIFLMSAKPPNGVLWYVYAVFILALLSPVQLFVFQSKIAGRLSIMVAPIVCHVLLKFTPGFTEGFVSYGYIAQIIDNFPAYCFGAFCGYWYDKTDRTDMFGSCLLAVLCALFFNNMLEGLFVYTLIRILPMALIFLLPINENKDRVFHTSFLIYAIHRPIQMFVRDHGFHLILKYVGSIFLANVIYILLSLVLVVTAAYLIYSVLNRLAPKALRLLTGGRA